MFLSVSPHLLVVNIDARDALLEVAKKKTLCLIVIDEIHLHVQHGMTFWPENRTLRDIIFLWPLFHPKGWACVVKFLGISISATLPSLFTLDLSCLVLLLLNHAIVIRATAAEFAQHEIEMSFSIVSSGGHVKTIIGGVMKRLKTNDNSTDLLLYNVRYNDAVKYLTSLEAKRDTL